MQTYVTQARITVPPGTVMRLTAEQAFDRAHQLESRNDGCVVAREQLTFKAGETLAIEGDLGVATMRLLEPAAAAAEQPDGDESAQRGARRPRARRGEDGEPTGD